ncbi:uncharacterized protein LOC132279441 [Cornus florida]|uniref:uncharacterized protein LOC132279441 n=1 Tax=Cornus florida TaxID=4283 RepID=UPI00289684EB|nr:uncharacterized protein LOC132279441 [Cornus florida]
MSLSANPFLSLNFVSLQTHFLGLIFSPMAEVARPVFCKLASQKPAVPVPVQRVKNSNVSSASLTGTDKVKIVLQPRLCTLRLYGYDQVGMMMKLQREGGDGVDDEGGDGCRRRRSLRL